MVERFDVIVAGGGLQAALIAMAVTGRSPDARVAILERGPRLFAGRTWSHHALDVPRELAEDLAPLVEASWPTYEVAFPGLERRLASRYSTVSAERAERAVAARLARRGAILCGAEVESIDARGVVAGGTRYEAGLTIDARGAERPRRPAAYQKFVGVELELSEPARRRVPMLMDARVEQHGELRFVYVLPLSPRRVLVEDTYYSLTPELDVSALKARALAYAEAVEGLRGEVARVESGVLEISLRADAPEVVSDGVIRGGLRGGWFHPATGYSFSASAKLAALVARGEATTDAVRALARRLAPQRRFGVLLNRMMFGLFDPEQRWRPLARFYHLPEDTIERFYALETTLRDRARIVFGRPLEGVSLRRALSRGQA